MRSIRSLRRVLFAAVPCLLWCSTGVVAADSVPVTVENFIRAETDTYFAKFHSEGKFGKLRHEREMADIDHQTVIRLNRDTLYSFGVFDLEAGPLTLTLPDPGTRYMSVLLIDQDHHNLDMLYAPGTFTIDKQKIGTRYVGLAMRTFANPGDPADMSAAHALQDAVRLQQSGGPGTFEVPNWDAESLKKVRDAILALNEASGVFDSSKMFGRRGEVDPVMHLLGTAAGWGGNPRAAALYGGGAPEKNDGRTPYVLNFKDVPVDGFWSISVYNKAGFFEKNDKNAYVFNSITARPNADGSYTIHFGGDENAINYLPITPGWNYVVRMYRPRKEILDGTWRFPEPQEAK
jgi:hypothetical protein